MPTFTRLALGSGLMIRVRVRVLMSGLVIQLSRRAWAASNKDSAQAYGQTRAQHQGQAQAHGHAQSYAQAQAGSCSVLCSSSSTGRLKLSIRLRLVAGGIRWVYGQCYDYVQGYGYRQK